MTERRRRQIANWRRQIDVIEQIREVHGKLQAVALPFRWASAESGDATATAARPTLTAAAANSHDGPTAPRTTPGASSSPSASARLRLTLLTLVGLARRGATGRRAAEAPGLAHAHIDGEKSRTVAVVSRNQRFSWRGVAIEITKRSADEAWVITIGAVRRKGRPFGKLPIQVRVLTRRDVERTA